MRKSDLKKLSVAKLLEVQEWVEEAIAEKQVEEKAALKAKMAEMAAEAGLSLSDIVGGGRGGKRGKVPVKYRHPKDPNLTWTGRGRRPKWVVEAGGSLERFRV